MNIKFSQVLSENKNIFVFIDSENTFVYTEFCLDLLRKKCPHDYKIICLSEKNIDEYIPSNFVSEKLFKFKKYNRQVFNNYLAALVLYYNGGLFLSPNIIITKEFSIPDFLLQVCDVVMFSDAYRTPCGGYMLAKQGALILCKLIDKYEAFDFQFIEHKKLLKGMNFDRILKDFLKTVVKEEILLLDSEKYGYLAEKSLFGVTGKQVFQNYYFSNNYLVDEFLKITKGISYLQEFYIPKEYTTMKKSVFLKQKILLVEILKILAVREKFVIRSKVT